MRKRSCVILPISGTSRISCLEENVAAVAVALSEAEFMQLDGATTSTLAAQTSDG